MNNATNVTSFDAVLDLSQATDRRAVGGKAHTLQHLQALGLPVPPGFVITQRALIHFLAANQLTAWVNDYLAQAASLASSDLRSAYNALCAAVHAAPLPPDLRQAIHAQAAHLWPLAPAGLVVRSSASQEDGMQASFAGVYQSELGIQHEDALADAVRRVWAAAWSPGALAYARRLAIDLSATDMAILVQPVIPATQAGVLFTADPLTGNPWHFVINATLGLAPAMISGADPADAYVVVWDTAEILQRTIATKPTMLQANHQGLYRSAVPLAQQNLPALTDPQIQQLARLALAVDRAFDYRVDLEWVCVDETIQIVQARPIPALPPFFPHALHGADAEQSWTPADPVWYRTAKPGERLVAPFFQDRSALELWLRHSPGAFFPQQSGQERDLYGYRYQTPWQWTATSYTVEETIAWLQQHEAALWAGWLGQQAAMQAACQQAMTTLARTQSAAELIPALLMLRDAEIDFMAATWGAPQWMIFTCEWLLKEFLGDLAPDFALGRLLQGLPSLSQVRTEAAQVLGRALDEPAVRQALLEQPLDTLLSYLVQHYPTCQFLQAYTALCWQFGMRPPAWPAAWRGEDDSTQLLLVIKKSILGEGQDVREVMARGTQERQQAVAELRARIAAQDATRLPRFDQLLAWAQAWTPQLDNRGWLAGFIYVRLLCVMQATGARLVAEGVMAEGTDIYLLTPADLVAIAAQPDVNARRAHVAAQQHAYERNRRLTPLPLLGQPPAAAPIDALPDQPVVASEADTSGQTLLHGQGLAPGQVYGTARKSDNLQDAAFLDSLTGDDILVYPGYRTWPDWLSLFMVVKGVVTVQGVQLHHAAQIARECGVPYVNLPHQQWETIPDGAPLWLDGTQGTVRIE